MSEVDTEDEGMEPAFPSRGAILAIDLGPDAIRYSFEGPQGSIGIGPPVPCDESLDRVVEMACQHFGQVFQRAVLVGQTDRPISS